METLVLMVHIITLLKVVNSAMEELRQLVAVMIPVMKAARIVLAE